MERVKIKTKIFSNSFFLFHLVKTLFGIVLSFFIFQCNPPKVKVNSYHWKKYYLDLFIYGRLHLRLRPAIPFLNLKKSHWLLIPDNQCTLLLSPSGIFSTDVHGCLDVAEKKKTINKFLLTMNWTAPHEGERSILFINEPCFA